MSLFAITGGIGAGKTTVLSFFAKCGGVVLDADDVAHKLYLPGQPAYAPILQRWGEKILSPQKTIDRQAVAAIVFQDQAERSWLNQLLHPLIQDSIRQQANQATAPCFCALPLLYEAKWHDWADAVISSWCTSADQHQRLLNRGWTEEQINARLDSQLSMDYKLEKSQFAIISSCSWSCLEQQCNIIFNILNDR